MFMFLIKILSPKNIPSHQAEWDWRVHLYYWLLRALLPLYKRSVISDAVFLGSIQVFHNMRDYWYEQELRRFNIIVAPSNEKRSIPYCVKRKYRHSRLFNWSDSIHIVHRGAKYCIKRSKGILIETDKEGELLLSTERDFVLHSEFWEKGLKQQTKTNIKKVTHKFPQPSDVKGFLHKIAIKDTAPIETVKTLQSPEIVKHQGFEENIIF